MGALENVGTYKSINQTRYLRLLQYKFRMLRAACVLLTRDIQSINQKFVAITVQVPHAACYVLRAARAQGTAAGLPQEPKKFKTRT
jgi:hypothetical protein